MKFLDRLTLLVKADAHGVLEQLEERSLLAKQHLREAELELDRKRAQADAVEEECRRRVEEAEHLESEIATLDGDIELALAGDKDELARFSVRRLLPKRRAAEAARRRVEELCAQQTSLREALEIQEIQFDELVGRVRNELAAARARDGDRAEILPPVADEEVELELLRRRSGPVAGGLA